MNIQILAQQHASFRIPAEVPARFAAGRRIQLALRTFATALLTAIEKSQSAQAARIIHQHRDLIQK